MKKVAVHDHIRYLVKVAKYQQYLESLKQAWQKAGRDAKRFIQTVADQVEGFARDRNRMQAQDMRISDVQKAVNMGTDGKVKLETSTLKLAPAGFRTT